jgi:hypothetical protein
MILLGNNLNPHLLRREEKVAMIGISFVYLQLQDKVMCMLAMVQSLNEETRLDL